MLYKITAAYTLRNSFEYRVDCRYTREVYIGYVGKSNLYSHGNIFIYNVCGSWHAHIMPSF